MKDASILEINGRQFLPGICISERNWSTDRTIKLAWDNIDTIVEFDRGVAASKALKRFQRRLRFGRRG